MWTWSQRQQLTFVVVRRFVLPVHVLEISHERNVYDCDAPCPLL
jgi:hypothetical protein